MRKLIVAGALVLTLAGCGEYAGTVTKLACKPRACTVTVKQDNGKVREHTLGGKDVRDCYPGKRYPDCAN